MLYICESSEIQKLLETPVQMSGHPRKSLLDSTLVYIIYFKSKNQRLDQTTKTLISLHSSDMLKNLRDDFASKMILDLSEL